MRFFLLILILSGCSTTIKPTFRVTQAEASFDGNTKDSGVKEYINELGFVISDNAVDRYNKLCIKYNYDVVGLSKIDNKNILTKQGMVRFLELTDKNLQ